MPHELTDQQREAFQVMRWLYGEGSQRRTGRTYLLALTYIYRALQTRSEYGWIEIEDHHDGRNADLDLIRVIEHLVRETGSHFDMDSRRRFRIPSASLELRTYLEDCLAPAAARPGPPASVFALNGLPKQKPTARAASPTAWDRLLSDD